MAFEESVLAADVELPVAFQAVRFLVDAIEVVPDAPQVGHLLGVEQTEDAAIGFGAGRLQW